MPEWITRLFDAIDRMDPDALAAFLTEDASFRFGSAAAVSGRAAAREAVAGFFTTIKGLSHRIIEVWEQGDTVICEGEATYARHSGEDLTLPFLNVFRMQGDLIADYRIYIDPSPLFAA